MTELITEGGELARELVNQMERITWDRYGEVALSNARENLAVADYGTSLAELRDKPLGEGDSAIVIAAGPSIRFHDPIRHIKETGYKGTIIATDSALYYCLRNGIVPHLVVTLDPHASHVVRWFGDPNLCQDAIDKDDYFRRQDMDRAFADDLVANRALVERLNAEGHKINIALATTSAPSVTRRVIQAGMKVHWWNPMLDDPDEPDSATRQLYRMHRRPCMNAGGNVGSASWMIAHAVLGKKHVALTGMDFSYYDGTPHKCTQYYYTAIELVGEENLDKLFVKFLNPHTNTWFYTDTPYLWFRQSFLEMVPDAECRTYNCTGGGILFGDGIEWTPLSDFIGRCA
ncbi:MAG: DUF115 domain-containing protein [Magnetospirillum sp.]|nr:DUF115 domain-containing protein [Magnetospirillum sp.]